jgi:hypothetical protein
MVTIKYFTCRYTLTQGGKELSMVIGAFDAKHLARVLENYERPLNLGAKFIEVQEWVKP